MTELRIVASVLTYNAPRSLERCVAAIDRQSLPVTRLLVVDNASEPAVEVECAVAHEIVCQPENTGPAGGHAAGIARFLELDADLIWIMDDDCIPAADALEHLVEAAEARRADGTGPAVLFPNWIVAATGEIVRYPAWCGVLLERETVELIGVPNEALFWWAEDTEYLRERTKAASVPTVFVSGARVLHARSSTFHDPPAWKTYYESRNTVYLRKYVQAERLPTFFRARKCARSVLRIVAKVLLFEGHKTRKLWFIARGARDGWNGQLGRQVPASVDRDGVAAARG